MVCKHYSIFSRKNTHTIHKASIAFSQFDLNRSLHLGSTNGSDTGRFRTVLQFGSIFYSPNGLQLETEAFRLAAEELGMDFDRLVILAHSKRGQALANLNAVLGKEPTIFNDPDWDAEELRKWSETVKPEVEERVTSTAWETLRFEVPNIQDVLGKSTFSVLEQQCNDLSGNLTTDKETFLDLASELNAKEPLTIDIEELLRTAPLSPQPKSPSPVSAANEQAE